MGSEYLTREDSFVHPITYSTFVPRGDVSVSVNEVVPDAGPCHVPMAAGELLVPERRWRSMYFVVGLGLHVKVSWTCPPTALTVTLVGGGGGGAANVCGITETGSEEADATCPGLGGVVVREV
jgi:hypothetical protein